MVSRSSDAVKHMPPQGTKVTVPEIGITLPVLWHPDNDATERHVNVVDRPFITAFYGSDEATDAYIATRVPSYAGLLYPHAVSERLFSLQRMINAIQFMEEGFEHPDVLADDAGRANLRSCYLAVLDGVEPPDRYPGARLLFESLPPITAAARPRVAARFLQVVREQVEMLAKQAVRDVGTLTFQQYIELRRTESFGYGLSALAEYAIDIDLADELAADAALLEVRDAAVDSVALVNDLFSFRKEIQSMDPVNSIWILMREEHLDIQSAVNELAQRCRDCERRFVDARQTVLDGPLGQLDSVRAYVTEQGHILSGNWEFHKFSERYHGAGSTGTYFSSGDIVIETLPTLNEIAAADAHPDSKGDAC